MKQKIIIFLTIIIILLGHIFIIKDGIIEYNKNKAQYEEGKPTHIEYLIEELRDGVWVETDRYKVYITD